MFKKKFPFIHQLDAMQCGVACLQMVCKHYGKKYTAVELEKLCPPTKEGVSLLAMSKAVEQLGFKQVCGRFTIDDLAQVALPCILHWKQSHFVVLYEVKNNKKGNCYCVADPEKGMLSYNRENMQEHWVTMQGQGKEKGIAMLLEPLPLFYQKTSDSKANINSRNFLMSYLLRYKWLLGQVALGMGVGCVLQFIFPMLTQAVVDIGIDQNDIHFIYLVLLY